MTAPSFLTVSQAAAEIQVARKTVYSWIRRGCVKAAILPGGTEYRIRRIDWKAFLDTLYGTDRQPEPPEPPSPPPAPLPKGPRDFFALGAGLTESPRRDP